MNGFLYQAVKLVSYVKLSLENVSNARYRMSKYDHMISFIFAANGPYFPNMKTESVQEWVALLKQRGLREILLYANPFPDVMASAGFDEEKICIVTTFNDGFSSYWAPRRGFNRIYVSWDSYYHETIFQGPPNLGFAKIPDPSESFQFTLMNIELLARSIGFNNFAGIFREAYGILTNKKAPGLPRWMWWDRRLFRKEELRLLLAASEADVFGGMGSWNDTPVRYAHDFGKDEEYARLTRELFCQTRLAVMYAVNNIGPCPHDR